MSKKSDDQVISGGKTGSNKNNNKNGSPGITNLDHWERDFEDLPWYTKIEKILEMPEIKDMAGVMIRGVFKSDRQRIAHVRLAARHIKFHDNRHQEMLRMNISSMVAMRGLGRLDALFAGTNLIAPAMYRVAMGMPKTNDPENVHHGSDFREQREPEERRD